MKFVGVSALVSLLVAATLSQASAAGFGFQVCNKSGGAVRIAAGYQDADSRADNPNPTFHTEGWWRLEAGQCKILFRTNAQFVSVRAEVVGDSSRGWFGDLNKCVKDEDFKYSVPATSTPDCTAGYRRVPFKVVDTGVELVDPYTYTLN